MGKTNCEVDGCTRPHFARGFCQKHYTRQLRTGSTELRPKPICSIAGCEQVARRRGWCDLHYGRWRLKGSAEWLPPPIKTSKVTAQGYVIVRVPEHPAADRHGFVLEHRYVMGLAIGRALLSSESVHHKNGDKTDNRLENLELWTRSHPTGQRVEDKVQWAIELLHLYRPTVLKEPS